jgi:hypothetical protein
VIGGLIANGLDFNDPMSRTKATKFGNTANLWRPVPAVTDRRPPTQLRAGQRDAAISQSNWTPAALDSRLLSPVITVDHFNLIWRGIPLPSEHSMNPPEADNCPL